MSFPPEFLWGACVFAHQVEGANFASDWWAWEQRPGRVRDGRTSQAASDHYNRFETDLDLAKKLGLNALLVSVEWSRIEPEEGSFDEAAIGHYSDVLEAAVSRGIEPVCVLHAVTNPLWFTARYGWHHAEAPALFERYVKRFGTRAAPVCKWWIPISEPVHLLEMGWVERIWPPGSASLFRLVRAFRNLLRAHSIAYRIIHELRPDAMVGAEVRGRVFQPSNVDSAWDVRAAKRCSRWANHLQLEVIRTGRLPFRLGVDPILKGAMDFIGLSFYGSETVRFHPARITRLFYARTDKQGNPVSVEQAERYPDGLRSLVSEMAQYRLPVLVTGNGVATDDDRDRRRFILDHLLAVHQSLQDGADVRGYFYRSFLDGFEWTRGYLPRYGLVHVDRKTLARTPNESAFLFKDICETGTFRPGTLARFCPEWQVGLKGQAI